MRIAMDTSILMAPVETGVRLFEELDALVGDYEALVPDPVREELAALAQGSGTAARAASVGLDLADRCEPLATDESYADDALVALAERGAVDAVATNDTPLRDRVLAAGVPAIHIRGRTQLTRTQPN
jgi:rRNA-processing protein FCF1